MWHDPKMTPLEKIQRLGEEVPDSPVKMEAVTDEQFKVKNAVIPPSEDLKAKFKYFLTMMYAAQHAQKCLLEANFREQAETINLLHKTRYGFRVDAKYHKVSKEEIQEMIKDMGWNEPKLSTSKRPLESSSEKPTKKVRKNHERDSLEESVENRDARKDKEKHKEEYQEKPGK